jgi:prepilin-type N-terminal cleavage/methylation domain-containing protein
MYAIGFRSESCPRRALSLIELLVVLALLGVFVAMLAPAVQAVRDSSTATECRNNLRTLGTACLAFHDAQGYYPRNTIRPRGTTELNAQPPGNAYTWGSGSFESWLREIAPYIDQPSARAQDSILVLGCPADPRGPHYTVPTYGFTWYVGVYSNSGTPNNGIIVDDSALPTPLLVASSAVTDGTSNTMMVAERPPSADGQWGWWDSACCSLDSVSPIRGFDPWVYDVGLNGQWCTYPAFYGFHNYLDNCAFNSIWSLHHTGGNFCMGDGSVRTISYHAHGLGALASRAGDEVSHED